MNTSILRQIPKMDKVLELPAVQAAGAALPRALVRSALNDALQALRQTLQNGGAMPSQQELERMLADAVQKAGSWQLRRVINATGVVLHTNLGRAPLGSALAAHVAETAAGYSTLEYQLSSGCRGSRHAIVEQQLCRLTGAEAAMVVNNNAAAVFLMLHTLAKDKRVIVSRGELVEIGGAFRVPEIMSASGASLLEIGTTNKTRCADYEAALQEENVGALLKVHTSNFQIIGFSENVSLEALVPIAKAHDMPLLYDMGAGFLIRPELLGLHEGIYIPDAVRCADVCCFSGDKLLGAGQAGILLGKKEYIDRMKQNQLSRMLRVDKMTLASLEAVLRLYADPDAAREKLPVLRMLSAVEPQLAEQAGHLADTLNACCPALHFEPVPCTDEPGGGSLPGLQLPGWAIAVTGRGQSAEKLEAQFRALPVPVIGRIHKDQYLLCVRTLLPEDEDTLAELVSGLR